MKALADMGYSCYSVCVAITFLERPNYSFLTEINMFGFNYSSLNVSVEMVLHHHWSHYMLGRLTSLLITIVVDKCGGADSKVDGD